MPRVSFYTLGCKLNQAETAMLAEDFVRHGYKVVQFGEPADVCVVNTCTVTAKSDYQCRQALRRAVREVPNAVIVAVGCYSQLQPEVLADIPGVDLVLGSNNKFELAQRIKDMGHVKSSAVFVNQHAQQELFVAPNPGHYIGRTRAFLKIQDGCNSFCTYCAVPSARGPSRSASISNVLNRAQNLVKRDYKEIVLTGVHVGRFGKGSKSPTNLADLLSHLVKIDGLERIRISSLEPQELTEELLDIISSSNKICHHFHIPLQSGDDNILNKMGRGYTTSEYSDIVEKVATALPNAGLGTDVIVGFPGETAEQFQNTLELIQNMPFSYLHVFKYSSRPNTVATKLPDNVPIAEKNSRSQQLRELGHIKKNEFYCRQIGKRLRVLFERKQNSYMTGWADNYSRVAVIHGDVHANELGMVHIEQAKESLVIGTLVSSAI